MEGQLTRLQTMPNVSAALPQSRHTLAELAVWLCSDTLNGLFAG
jgi:hypothetical protein